MLILLVFEPITGFFVALLGAGLTVYFSYRWMALRPSGSSSEQAEIRRNELERNKSRLADKIETLETRQEQLTDEFDTIRNQLGLPDSVSPQGVRDFFQQAVRLKKQYQKIQSSQRKLYRRRREFQKKLEEPADCLNNAPTELIPEDHQDNPQQLFTAIEQVFDLFDPLERLQKAEKQRDDLIQRALELLNQGPEDFERDPFETDPFRLKQALRSFVKYGEDREKRLEIQEEFEHVRSNLKNVLSQEVARKALAPLEEQSDTEPWMIGSFGHVCEQYASMEQVAEAKESSNREWNRLTEKLENAEEKNDLLRTESRYLQPMIGCVKRMK